MRRLPMFLVAVARRFYADQCLLWASALAYASILSIVPLLAVMFSVLKGLGVQRRLEPILLSRLSLSTETTEAIIGYIDRTNVSTLGALGAALLLVTAISTLTSIENSFNHIWRVAQGRTIWRKISDYLSVMFLTPFLLLAAVALTSSLQLDRVLAWLMQHTSIGVTVVQLLAVLPVFVNAVALGVLYAVMPYRRQSPVAVVVGALVAGTAWQVVQWAYVALQIGVAQYNAIYGALSQLPITLAWLYVSWAIVLAGAEIAAVYELGSPATEAKPEAANSAAIALEILVRAAHSFAGDAKGVDPLLIARSLRVSPDAVAEITEKLAERGWLVSVEAPQPHYILGRDPASIELSVLGDLADGRTIPPTCAPEVHTALRAVAAAGREVWAQRRLADVIASAPANAQSPDVVH